MRVHVCHLSLPLLFSLGKLLGSGDDLKLADVEKILIFLNPSASPFIF